MKQHILRELKTIQQTLQFFTRLPVSFSSQHDLDLLANCHAYIPLVGILCGGIMAILYTLLHLHFPQSVSVVMLLIFGLFLTGGFHEDGLADTCDGLGGGFTKERKLLIMKDSRIGSYGSIAISILLLAKYASFCAFSSANFIPALITANMMSRWSSIPLICALPYVRENSVGEFKPLIAPISKTKVFIISLFYFTPFFLYLGARQFFSSIFYAAIITAYSGWRFYRQIGGITGDCCGATNQLVEVAVLLSFF